MTPDKISEERTPGVCWRVWGPSPGARVSLAYGSTQMAPAIHRRRRHSPPTRPRGSPEKKRLLSLISLSLANTDRDALFGTATLHRRFLLFSLIV